MRTIKIECPLPQALGGPRPLKRLERGGRLSVLPTGSQEYVELQVSRIDPNSPELWSSTHKATNEDFEHLAGDDWQRSLLDVGASNVGPRESVIGDDGRRRGFLCAVLGDGDFPLPVVAYSLTRILPLLNIWSPLHESRRPLPNQMRVYVIELSPETHTPKIAKRCVYVGDTARTPEDRFATHKTGGRTAATAVFRHGLALLPRFYEHIPPVGHSIQRTARELSSSVETWLKKQLEDMGYCVHGGEGGIHEASFAR